MSPEKHGAGRTNLAYGYALKKAGRENYLCS